MRRKQENLPIKSCPELRSEYWLHHFRENLGKTPKIDWDVDAGLDMVDDARLIRSIQAWQLGETSDGTHLLRATCGFLDQFPPTEIERWEYLEAVKLFIREEQKHGENLGRYLNKVGAKRIKFDFGDAGFRLVRYLFSNMEIWSASVLMVETMALIYYKALRDSGRCDLLSGICADILGDEAYHLKFQIERIRTYYRDRSLMGRRVTGVVYQCLYAMIVGAVWLAHHHALRKGGLTLGTFWRASWRKYSGHWREIKKEADLQNGGSYCRLSM